MNVLAVEAPKVAAPPSLESIYQDDLYHYLKGDEIKMILSGELEFASLYRDHSAAQSRGVAILLPDWDLPANNQKGLNYLRLQLNDYGWITYALNVPPPVELNSHNIADNPKLFHAPIQQQITDEAYKDYQQLLLNRFKSVYKSALEHPGFVIVIAQGTTAAILVDYFSKPDDEMPEEMLDAIILLSSYIPDTKLNQEFSIKIGQTPIPILDLYHSHDNRFLLKELNNRKRASIKYHKMDYRQRQLFDNFNAKQQQPRLLKEIYGFLTKVGM